MISDKITNFHSCIKSHHNNKCIVTGTRPIQSDLSQTRKKSSMKPHS